MASGGLREHALSGAKWMGLTRVVAESAGFIASIVLARLVSPAEFGRTAVALFIGTLMIAVSQQGVGSFLVAHANAGRRHFEAASFASLAAGLAGSVLVLALAFTAVPAIFGQRIGEYVLLSVPTCLFAGIAAAPIAQLQRQLRFKRLGVIEASASVVSPATAIVLAANGLGGRAIVLGGVLAAAVTALLACVSSPPARPAWHREELRETVRYGLPASGSSILYASARNIDYVLLAALIPAKQVGLYMRAFTLGTDYQTKISRVLLNVAFPILARARDLDEIRRVRMRMVRTHATVLFPLLIGLIAVAPSFVPWMYGERWHEAGGLTQILALGGMIGAVATGTGPLLMATGHTRGLLAYNIVDFVAFVVAVLAAVPFGITAVCVSVVAVRLLTFVLMQYLIVERRVGIPLISMVRDDVAPAMAAAVPQLVVTLLALRLGLDTGAPVAAAMAAAGAMGVVTYVALLRLWFPATWADVRMLGERLGVDRAARRLRPATAARSPR